MKRLIALSIFVLLAVSMLPVSQKTSVPTVVEAADTCADRCICTRVCADMGEMMGDMCIMGGGTPSQCAAVMGDFYDQCVATSCSNCGPCHN